jgi:hypothetical protein
MAIAESFDYDLANRSQNVRRGNPAFTSSKRAITQTQYAIQ